MIYELGKLTLLINVNEQSRDENERFVTSFVQISGVIATGRIKVKENN